jgi:transposase
MWGGEMRRIDYIQAIKESELELLALEQQLRGRRTAVRVQMLRLLKSRKVETVQAAAPIVGFSHRQLQNWWASYRAGGIEALLVVKRRPGGQTRLTEAAYTGLEGEMKAGRVATLKDAQAYLSREWGIVYRSLNGVWLQLRKRGAKPKTGRRRHRKANVEAQQTFKKTWAPS